MRTFLLIPTLIATFGLSACDHPSDSLHSAGGTRAKFFKDGVSDAQMTNDLNDCALISFRASMRDDATDITGETTKRSCMSSRGYEVFYN